MAGKAGARVIVTGRVQGVYFRMATRRAVLGRGVSGWVRNRPDGTVEALFEGDRAAVDDAVDWCRKGPPSARVERVDVEWGVYTGEFESFDIRF